MFYFDVYTLSDVNFYGFYLLVLLDISYYISYEKSKEGFKKWSFKDVVLLPPPLPLPP